MASCIKKNPKYFTKVPGEVIFFFHLPNALVATGISVFYAFLKVSYFSNVWDYHA